MKTESVYSFLVSGISPCVVDEFRQLSDEELKSRRVVRRVVDSKPGFPCRVTLEDADSEIHAYSVLLFHSAQEWKRSLKVNPERRDFETGIQL